MGEETNNPHLVIVVTQSTYTDNCHHHQTNMPRQGEGHIAHNAIDTNVNQVIHGAGDAKVGSIKLYPQHSILKNNHNTVN